MARAHAMHRSELSESVRSRDNSTHSTQRASAHNRIRCPSTLSRFDKVFSRRVTSPTGSSRASRSPTWTMTCTGSKAGSPTTGFGSMASHGSRWADRMLRGWKSWWSSTNFCAVRGSSRSPRDAFAHQTRVPCWPEAVEALLTGDRQFRGKVGEHLERMVAVDWLPQSNQHSSRDLTVTSSSGSSASGRRLARL
jgi:hypothetical protein